jgi:hypothetical protein
MLLVMASLVLGDRFKGAGGAFLDAPLNVPEKDAAVPGGLAADEIENEGWCPLCDRSGVLGEVGGDLVFATICASGAAGSLTPGTAWRDVVTLSAWSSFPLVIFTAAADRATDGLVGEYALFAPNGVSERPREEDVASEGSVVLGLSKLPSRSTDCDATERFDSGNAGD